MSRWIASLPYLVASAAAGLELAAILWLNEGSFTYSLDDPYIHLALSENIALGHYGLNAEAVSSPASSILWPFLLAPFAAFGWHVFVPLALCLLASGASVALLSQLARRSGFEGGGPAAIWRAGVVVLVLLFTNLVGLAFTGMEHSLQVALTLALVAGSIELQEGRAPPGWLLVAIVLGPLVRYENTLLSAAALLLLAWRGFAGTAWLCGALLLAGLGAFSGMLLALGLPALPASVLVKSPVVGQAGAAALVAGLDSNLRELLHRPEAVMLATLGGAFAAGAWLRRDRRDAPLLALGFVVLAGHVAAGRYGWFGRYEIYAVIVALAIGGHALRVPIASATRRLPPLRGLVALALVLAPLLARYPWVSVRTPWAANNVYQQHAQMRRFIVDFHRAPIAVNDVGLVSYRNPHPVLDVWGLASSEALSLRRARTPDWLGTLVAREKVPVAMIYRRWFKERIPPSWHAVADLELGRGLVSASDSVVTFYATDAAALPALRANLEAFAPGLPPGVMLRFL